MDSPTPGDREILPVLGLSDRVLIPGMTCDVVLSSVPAFGAVQEAARQVRDPVLAVFGARCALGQPSPCELFPVGVLAWVVRLRKRPCGHFVARLSAFARARRLELLRDDPFRVGRVERLADGEEGAESTLALTSRIRWVLQREERRGVSARDEVRRVRELIESAPAAQVPGLVAPLLAAVPAREWQGMLEAPALDQRLAFVLAHLNARRLGTRLAGFCDDGE